VTSEPLPQTATIGRGAPSIIVVAAVTMFAVRLAGPVLVPILPAIDQQIERYLQARVLISAIVGTATALAMWLVGLEHFIIWGVIAGVLKVLPYLGPTIAIALITLAAFLQFGTLEMAGIAGGLAMIVAVLEGNLITPWLTSERGI
jgi:predicted PurR-regulated permease PerM